MNIKTLVGVKTITIEFVLPEGISELRSMVSSLPDFAKVSGKEADKMIMSKELYRHIFGKFPLKAVKFNGVSIEVRE